MIISPGRRYIFVHIPKTGGTSLALALEDRAMRDDIMLGDTPKALNRRRRIQSVASAGRLWKHSTLSDIDGSVSIDEIKQAFAFTLVRNPWDRAVSYYHWLKEQSFDHPAVGLAKQMTFEGFVCHPDTQAAFRRSPAKSYMRRADGIVQCQAFIRLEAFAEDARLLIHHLGFSIELPQVNKSVRQMDYRQYYSDDGAAAIAQSCATDIGQFGYRFDP